MKIVLRVESDGPDWVITLTKANVGISLVRSRRHPLPEVVKEAIAAWEKTAKRKLYDET